MINTAIDFTSPELITDPFPALRTLQEQQPVHWNPSIKSWCLTRYDDVKNAYNDLRFSSERIRSFVARQEQTTEDLELLGECIGLWLVFNDPPTHTRLRKLTQKAFTRRGLQALRPAITRLVNELIDQVIERQEMDFVRDFAYPLPANVIADMLGVPSEYIEDLKHWSDDLAQFVLSGRINPDKYALAAASLRHMNALFDELIEQRRRQPGDKVMDELIAAHEGSDSLSQSELLAFCVLLLFAGHETTTHLFANGLRALLLHPEQMTDLYEHGRQTGLVQNAVNEMLRWDGPVISVSRIPTEDITLHGKVLPAGERVFLFTSAANRDPSVFPEPDRFNIRRQEAHKMIGFGFGIHICLGIHLARLEAEIGFPILLQRLKNVELQNVPLEWVDTLVIRGLQALPVKFGV